MSRKIDHNFEYAPGHPGLHHVNSRVEYATMFGPRGKARDRVEVKKPVETMGKGEGKGFKVKVGKPVWITGILTLTLTEFSIFYKE